MNLERFRRSADFPNLPYRRFPIGKAWKVGGAFKLRAVGKVELRFSLSMNLTGFTGEMRAKTFR
jgi:hypothetical protein